MKLARHGAKQVAALPLRKSDNGTTEVLLVTSRETQRWIVPKGWPMNRKSDAEAAVEAREEAGAVGTIDPEPIGRFSYFKRHEARFALIEVDVFRLKVLRQLASWPEQQQRLTRWFTPEQAAELVLEPGLSAILLALLDAPDAEAPEAVRGIAPNTRR